MIIEERIMPDRFDGAGAAARGAATVSLVTSPR
jgi:hypothetical protein